MWRITNVKVPNRDKNKSPVLVDKIGFKHFLNWNHEYFTTDTTTGKLNCVREQDRQASWNPKGISAAIREHAATDELCSAGSQLVSDFVFKWRCAQRFKSARMACEGRARNRMLRKRWIVRNPVVEDSDITPFILPLLFFQVVASLSVLSVINENDCMY